MPIDLVDVFSGDAFKMTSMSAAITRAKHQPRIIGSMGLFDSRPISTTVAVIEEESGLIALLPTRKRGAQASTGKAPSRTARAFNVPHIPHEDTILASDVQDVRKMSGTQLEAIADVVNKRLKIMRSNHETTWEHMHAGALRGVILDADGSTVLFNLFTDFGVSEQSTDFLLGTAGTNIHTKVMTVVRSIEDELGGAVYDHIHAFCGKTWFDSFITHAKVEAAYARFQDGIALRSDLRRGFVFNDVVFQEYRGKVGSTAFFADGEARFFPVGVESLFVDTWAPANFIETANQLGQPLYARQEIQKHGLGIDIHTQSNLFAVCTMPKVLHKGHTSN